MFPLSIWLSWSNTPAIPVVPSPQQSARFPLPPLMNESYHRGGTGASGHKAVLRDHKMCPGGMLG